MGNDKSNREKYYKWKLYIAIIGIIVSIFGLFFKFLSYKKEEPHPTIKKSIDSSINIGNQNNSNVTIFFKNNFNPIKNIDPTSETPPYMRKSDDNVVEANGIKGGFTKRRGNVENDKITLPKENRNSINYKNNRVKNYKMKDFILLTPCDNPIIVDDGNSFTFKEQNNNLIKIQSNNKFIIIKFKCNGVIHKASFNHSHSEIIMENEYILL